jgi:RimJ/RimL family protein N-acetyltransferase
MHRDPRVMATLGGMRSDEETARYLRDNLDHWDRYGYGIWAFRNKADRRFVGRAGLRNTHVGGEDEVELAYALVADYWNKGLATEMARAILKVAFEDIGLIDIVCFTLPANTASRRVMEKAGLTCVRTYFDEWLDVIEGSELGDVEYALTRAEWERQRAAVTD